jgi:hypothetical protein
MTDNCKVCGHSKSQHHHSGDVYGECGQFVPLDTDDAEAAEAENVRLREALEYYAKHYDWPADGPWGATSTDFGDKARAALSEHEKE